MHVQIGIGSIAGHKCGEDEAGYFDFPQKNIKSVFLKKYIHQCHGGGCLRAGLDKERHLLEEYRNKRGVVVVLINSI